jgi:ribosomal protein S18 acetylase RimI-like enzyme
VRLAGEQARLGGKVHPTHRRRGLGTRALRWTAARAAALGSPTTLVIRNEAANAGSAALYAQEGYSRDFAEDWLQHDLGDPLPSVTHRAAFVPWSADKAHAFFAVYSAAFAERWALNPAGNTGPAAEEWIAEYTEDPDFRPDLSLLALIAGQPVGFIAAGVLPLPDGGPVVGWISQVGTVPAVRGQAVGAGLVVAVLDAFRREGFPAVGLHVNVNNRGARRVYDQLGFRPVGLRVRYVKAVSYQPTTDG